MLLIGANTLNAIEKLLAKLADVEHYACNGETVGKLLETEVDELNACLLMELGTFSAEEVHANDAGYTTIQ